MAGSNAVSPAPGNGFKLIRDHRTANPNRQSEPLVQSSDSEQVIGTGFPTWDKKSGRVKVTNVKVIDCKQLALLESGSLTEPSFAAFEYRPL